jgi:hypothetical protein
MGRCLPAWLGEGVQDIRGWLLFTLSTFIRLRFSWHQFAALQSPFVVHSLHRRSTCPCLRYVLNFINSGPRPIFADFIVLTSLHCFLDRSMNAPVKSYAA